MKTGTNHFESLKTAVAYYAYGFTSSDVQEKVDRGEIKLGKPTISWGETLLIDRDRRYILDDGQA